MTQKINPPDLKVNADPIILPTRYRAKDIEFIRISAKPRLTKIPNNPARDKLKTIDPKSSRLSAFEIIKNPRKLKTVFSPLLDISAIEVFKIFFIRV